MIPLRAKLRDTSVFDDDAIYWMRCQSFFETMTRFRRPSHDEEKCSWTQNRYKERYAYLVAAAAGTLPPEQWLLCENCKGEGRVESSSVYGPREKICDSCKGGGYLLRHAGDVDSQRKKRAENDN